VVAQPCIGCPDTRVGYHFGLRSVPASDKW
jgi:hypothetical protein